MKPKKELIRVVRNAEGMVGIDPIGKAPGRGAYLCKSAVCLEKAVKSRALDRAFEQKMDTELYEKLKADFENYG